MGCQSLAFYLSKESAVVANQLQNHCKLVAKAIVPNEK